MNPFKTITHALDTAGIPYRIREHAPVRTSREAAIVRGYTQEEGMRRGAKAMIVRSEGKFYQFVLPGDRKLDFKTIKELLQTESASLASEEEVERVMGCRPGAVPPFGSLFGLRTYVDESLLENEEVDFNAGKHTVSITMKTADWKRIVKPIAASFVLKP